MKLICDDGIPAYRANGADVTLLNRWTFKHSTRRYNLYPVVVHINVDLAAQDNIVTVLWIRALTIASVTARSA